MRFLENFFSLLYEQLLPTSCIACEKFQNTALCSDCLNKLIHESMLNYVCCYQCGITLNASEIDEERCLSCQKVPPYFDATYCLDRYSGLLQNALHELKYQKIIAFSQGLSNAWNLVIREILSDLSADYLLPVPLSIPKLKQRGFNQSWEIARRIQCRSDIIKSPFILQRHHDSTQQAGSVLSVRELAIKDKFFIAPKYINQLRNRTIIVFDDVMTSGATLNEIARILKDNGVSHVINWVLLRAARQI